VKTASPFRRTADGPAATVPLTFDGQPVAAAPGETLAAALLAAGVRVTRQTPVSGAPRAPYCMMGACFDCLVEVDGRAVQACMTTVAPGMAVRTLERVPEVTGDA
jgi:predicted molibdopterin-dependent oxidoreductase YjgC